MRNIVVSLLIITIVSSSLTLATACPASIPRTTSPSLSLTSDVNTDTPSLSLTEQPTPRQTAPTLEEAEKELKENGWVAVDTAEMASELAGYRIYVPEFIPEGFNRTKGSNAGTFLVQTPGFGLPTSIPRIHQYAIVEQTYAQKGGAPSANEPFFVISQSRDEILGKGEPIDIGGKTGTRYFLDDAKNPARLVLNWSDGSLFYSLMGTLVMPLDEATLLRIATTVGVR